jgi:aspartokinase/homoserine dehydrogenase 1
MKVLKFGGKSLSNGSSLESSIEIIKKARNENIALVVSARGDTTNQLEQLLISASSGVPYKKGVEILFDYQEKEGRLTFDARKEELTSILQGVELLGEYSLRLKAKVLAFGELLSAFKISELLNEKRVISRVIDTRNIFQTDSDYESALLDKEVTEKLTLDLFSDWDWNIVPILTGFIASDSKCDTTTFGRNGTNYTATILANILNAEEVQNWTTVDGIYTADPSLVPEAKIISRLKFREANELANFGVNVLHAKTIVPLIEKNIPIRILNSDNPKGKGTIIDKDGAGKGIKAVSVIEDVALVSISGNGLLGKVGIDARIFRVLSEQDISVRNISQASSERGIGFIVNKEEGRKAKSVLEKEFLPELKKQDISEIEVNQKVAIISIIGRHNFSLEKAISGLRKNGIWLYLINNSINGEHISLVVSDKSLKKAVNVVHSQVFGVKKRLNVLAFGKGTVGKAFINQLLKNQFQIEERRNISINIVAVIDSKKVLFDSKGIGSDWESEIQNQDNGNDVAQLIATINNYGLENVVAIDNTASEDFVLKYPILVDNGIDVIASNKIGNTISYDFYKDLRISLKKKGKEFLYEANVGAGLPLIDTIKQLHHSGDQIKRIRGVFSGSLSYIFNNYSIGDNSFSQVLEEAVGEGYTEPDPREDLSGNDVGRKLLILARELDFTKEFSDVAIQSLIPTKLQSDLSVAAFLDEKETLNNHFAKIKNALKPGQVLRYIGDLSEDGELKVELIATEKETSLGNISGSDSIFEIYTEAYGDNPIVIQGAGAGAEVTARGVYSDLLRIGAKL